MYASEDEDMPEVPEVREDRLDDGGTTPDLTDDGETTPELTAVEMYESRKYFFF